MFRAQQNEFDDVIGKEGFLLAPVARYGRVLSE